MPALRSLLFLLFAVTNGFLVCGQPVDGHVSPPTLNDSIPITEIIRETEVLPSGTPKVLKLLAIGRYYLNQGRGSNLDTALIYTREAYAIGRAMRDTAGINESLARLCDLYMNKGDVVTAAGLLARTYGEERVRLLLVIAEGYVNLAPVKIPALEKAMPYISMAMRLADSLRSTHWRYECLMVQAKYFFEHGNLADGKNAILAIIKSCDSLKDIKGEGNYWSEMNTYMPVTDQTAAYHIYACRRSIHAYDAAGDHLDALYSLRDLGTMYNYVSELDSAQAEFMLFLRETAKLGITPSSGTNYELAALFLNKGDLAKALDYSIRALNMLDRHSSYYKKRYIYGQLALIYQLNDVPGEELHYGGLALEEAVRFKVMERHYFTTFVIDAFLKEGHPEQALAYLQQFDAANPVRSPEQLEPIAYNYGLIYDALGAYARAEPYFQQLAIVDTAAQLQNSASIFRHFRLNPFLIHLYTGRFYIHWGKYQQARRFLQKALADPLLDRQPTARSELQLLLYKTDSATGDLRSAIAHYRLHTAINDSIFTIEKMQQFQSLEVQYQTKQREPSIRLLQSEGERQRDQLKEASLLRKITLGGIILFFILSVWAYYAYQAKRRNVSRLLVQQEEINEKNLELEELLGEKNELLTEKNLLLQEVHHRVKNNLHTVMSLLESQSAYLSDKAVRSVLQDSQNRIHTISLLHQKLYWSSNVTSLEMGPYIAELSAFLGSSLGARERRITISQSVDPITLDISHALPIGLLLNEAITNALKHAFPDNIDQNAVRPGYIEVKMRQMPDGFILLQISDDGAGMPGDAAIGSHSLGLSLMKSIGQKLGGLFCIKSGAGVLVTLEFKPALTIPDIY